MGTFEGRFTDVQGMRIAVVIARFNDLVTGKMLSGCLDCLARHGVDTSAESAQLDVAWVPGSFELPLVAQKLAASGRYQVVITLGAVMVADGGATDATNGGMQDVSGGERGDHISLSLSLSLSNATVSITYLGFCSALSNILFR